MSGSRAAPLKVWLDTDPGFDDWMAWALLEALQHAGRLQLLGVSVVAGNAPLSRTLSNALRLKALHGWTTPVYAGCDRPLAQAQVTAQDVLGPLAMASIGRPLPEAEAAVTAGDAVQALIEAAHAHAGESTLLAIGPLTNVASAIEREPALLQLFKQVVIMGGSTDRGNTTAVAEFNIHADPEAAARVFDAAAAAGREIVMFGLNVCRQVLVGPEHVAALRAVGSDRAEVFADHLAAYVDIARPRGVTHMPLYDPTPVAWLVHPELFELEAARVDIELHGRFTRGMTVCEFRVPKKAVPNTRVAIGARGADLLDWAVQILKGVL